MTLTASRYTRFSVELNINALVSEWGPEGAGDDLHEYDLDPIHFYIDSLEVEPFALSVEKAVYNTWVKETPMMDMEADDSCLTWDEIQDADGNKDNEGKYLVRYFLSIAINGVLMETDELELLRGVFKNDA